MLTGSMETVPSSYEDSAILFDQAEDFGFIGEEDLLEEEEFERVESVNGGSSQELHTISRPGSINGDEVNSQNQEDELASTGILILGPSQMTTSRQMQARRHASPPSPSLSPRLSLPDSESLPTDLHSIHLESIHTSTSSVLVEESMEEQRRLRRSHALHMTYFALGSIAMLIVLCIFVGSTVSLMAERQSWVQSNQKLEDQLKRMQADWMTLATKYEMDQEASLATSRTIKATLQAQMDEQRKIIQDLYQEQRDLKEKKDQEKAERERRKQQEKDEKRFQRQEQARRDRTTKPPSWKYTNDFAKKFFDTDSKNTAKTFDIYWTDTEEAIMKWSDETQHKLGALFNSLGKKVTKAQNSFMEKADRFMTKADRTLQQVRTKIVKAWADFYAALHQPQEGWMEKAAPVVSTLLFATAAAALTEGTNRFVRYLQDEENED